MKSLLMRKAASHDKRCSWVNADDQLLVEYHDREWGVPIHSDRKHFEVLVLSGAQAGLNWSLVLKKREGYRRAFDNFDPKKVALARKLFDDKSMPVKEICETLHIGRSTLYRYINDKRPML